MNDDLLEHYRRDIDIVRPSVSVMDKEEEEEKLECTLDEEIRPAPYRKDLLSSFRK